MVINDIRFKGKRSINWKEVRAYLKEYVGDFYKVASTGDVIYMDLICQVNIRDQYIPKG